MAEGPRLINVQQVGGTHYEQGYCPHCEGSLKHWDIVEMFDLDYFIGSATKYLFRLGKKPGQDPLMELDKAISYLMKVRNAIERAQAGPTEGYVNQD